MSVDQWHWQQGDEPVPGYLLWGQVHLGRRCEIWVAWCRDRLTPMVLKVARPDRLDAADRRALGRERDALAAMDHPAIPRLFAAGIDGPVPHLVLELIEGRSLAAVLEDRGTGFDDHDTVLIGLQLAAILRHVHRRGFVHLDVKPDNLALRGDRLFLLDFDLALPAGTAQTPDRPRGSPAHMAPEQIACRPVLPAMDLFALGTVLFEVRSGRALFAPSEQRWPQIDDPPPDLAALLPHDTSSALAALISDLVEPDAAARPGTDRVLRLLDAAVPAGTERLWPAWVTSAVTRAGPMG